MAHTIRLDNTLNEAQTPKKFIESDGKRSFLRVPVARSGVFHYRARDLIGVDTASHGFKSDDIVKVYRPPDTFSKPLLEKAHILPITNDHPSSHLLTPNNSKREVCGAASNPNISVENGVSILYYDIKLWGC